MSSPATLNAELLGRPWTERAVMEKLNEGWLLRGDIGTDEAGWLTLLGTHPEWKYPILGSDIIAVREPLQTLQ